MTSKLDLATGELVSTKAALEAEQKAHVDTTDFLRETAKDCFDMALEKIKHLNPLIGRTESRP